MYRTMLLAFDGSRPAHEALRQGRLAVLCQANVYLLAVLAPELSVLLAEAAVASDLPERERAEVERVLMDGAKELRDAGLSVETQLGSGNPAEEIGRVAREVAADLIVVGHRDQGLLSRWWSGSTGASLVAHAPCAASSLRSRDSCVPICRA